ncbi:MAG: glycosyltransferase, partial [Candidatus Marinimicrobia bacterium]|nr:glycosyltransferase [Candidatus Neomarinimicrobiota bacterium]
MNILYGIQGTGNGHITRSRLLVPLLRKKGFNVDVILSGRKKEEYWDMECFKPYDTKFGITFQ